MGYVAAFDFNRANQKRNLAPGSVVVKWNTGGQEYTLTDDGAGGLTGAGDGTVSYATGQIFVNPQPAPAPTDGNYTIDYEDWRGTAKQNDSITLNGNGQTNYAPAAAMREGSIEIKLTVKRKLREWRYSSKKAKAPRTEYVTQEITLTDDGNGNLRRQKDGPNLGTVNYATGEINFDARGSYTYRVYQESKYAWSGNYKWSNETDTATETYEGSTATIRWTDAADPVAVQTETRPIPGLVIDLTPGSQRAIIPNSVIFTIGSEEFRDQDGAILKDWSPITNAGTAVGVIDYATGQVTMNEYPANMPTSTPVALVACTTTLNQAPANTTVFRTAGAPLREGSLIVNATDITGKQITLNADTSGHITGPDIVSGFVDTQTGLVTIQWTNENDSRDPITPATVRYSAVSYSFLPLDADLVGLDATRLPSDGRVPQFNLGDVIVVSNTQQQEVVTATPGQVIDFGRVNQAEAWVEGANGNRLAPDQYTLDTDAGKLTFADPLNLIDSEANAVTEPLTVYNRVEDMGLATDIQITGQISLNIPLSQDYTAGDTIASAAVLYGDIRARAHTAFHQKSFNGSTWSDDLIGDETTAKYNLVSHPIEVTNQGSIQERWAVRFTSSSSFEVIGETVGIVATGNTSTDLAPTNQATGAPYFTIRKEGWGSGWVSGNTLRFNTDGGQAPFWVARTIVAGRAVEETDQFATQNRGDAD